MYSTVGTAYSSVTYLGKVFLVLDLAPAGGHLVILDPQVLAGGGTDKGIVRRGRVKIKVGWGEGL